MSRQTLAVAALASWPSTSDVLGGIDGRTALVLLVPGGAIALCLAVWLARGPAGLPELRPTRRRSTHDQGDRDEEANRDSSPRRER